MKKAILIVAILFAGASTTWASPIVRPDMTLRLGGGFLWNTNLPTWADKFAPNLHASLDVGRLGPVSFVPFYDYSQRHGIATSFYGLNFYGHLPIFSERTELYYGPAIGFAHKPGINAAHVGFTVGWMHQGTRRLGLFLEGKYSWASKGVANGMGIYGGVTFHITNHL